MAVRAGRLNRPSVIGHPVTRSRPLGDTAAAVDNAIKRRNSSRAAPQNISGDDDIEVAAADQCDGPHPD